MKKNIKIFALAIFSLVVIFNFTGCKKKMFSETTTGDVNIYEYLKIHPTEYSDFAVIVERSGYNGFLSAYGAYTLFAPTNAAVQLYLTDVSKTLSGLTVPEAQNIVKFHLLEDTLTTTAFKDGKLPTITMYGQFLLTSVSNTGGVSLYNINRQALVTSANIKTGNGIIHQIDHVLKPASKTIPELIAADTKFSIFKEALVATGYYDTLNKVSTSTPKRWFTVLAETNKALSDSGFASFAALKAKLSNTGNPLNPLDSLNIYIKYHIIPEAKYLADIVSASSHYTLAPLEVLASSLEGEKALINDLNFNGVHEPGIELERSTSDISATTGVLHTALAHFKPKVRVPAPIYWDVADFPEVRKLAAVFRKSSISFAYGTIKDIAWDKTTNTLDYAYSGSASSFPTYYGDYLSLPMGTTSRHLWLEFTSPIIIKGKYKVWICYRQAKTSSGSYMPCSVSYDGTLMARGFTFTDQRPNVSDGELEALGWKNYTTVGGNVTMMVGKYLGIIDVQTTDRHKFKIQALPASGTGQPANYLDMIHIIPIDQNQYLPRFNRDGSLQYF